MFLNDPLFYCLAIPAVLVTGISKTGFGGGLGVMAVPLLSLVVTPRQAAAIMLPLLCLTDLFGTREFWNKWDTKNLKILMPASLIGVITGSVIFRLLNTSKIQFLVGLIAVGFTVRFWIAGRQLSYVQVPSAIKGGFWGAIAGFTSFVAHSGGPPANVFLLPQKLEKRVFVATSIIFFAFLNYIKLVPYIMLGLFQAETLRAALILCPLVPLSTRLGGWLNNSIDEKQFYRISYALLFVTGLKLLYDGIFA
jgi:uncharacterized membrane protein YfcA